ncbi:MAG: HAD family hydrolase [Pleurocapsa sp.]
MSQPILQAITDNCLGDIRLLATDMDGTLTQQGKFTANLIRTLEQLRVAGIDVVIVTGRSAGWVDAIATYLPIVGAIAENGGLWYGHHGDRSQLLTEVGNIQEHRQQLASIFQLLKSKFPQIQESADNRFRITDWTFDVADLSMQELEALHGICQNEGWGFTYSTVQCHIKPLPQNKADALEQVVNRYYPDLKSKQIITIGDSPNDESLFNRDRFPLSVGVANILTYRDRLTHLPVYVTSKDEGEGFCELAKLLINSNKRS